MVAGQNPWLWCLLVAPVWSFVAQDHAPSQGLSPSSIVRQQQTTRKRRKNSAFLQRSSLHRTRLYMDYGEENKLWERLEVEEDEETCWYLLNCVATMELALLQQCQSVTADMKETEIEKFVVPLEKKTRSHGSKKIVTETKVKYPGYVFAKLRLCSQTYQAIQQLDLCRSWMGTINQRGHRKLPPRPVALNDQEIEKFGLEALEETDSNELEIAAIKTDESGVIFDDDNEEDDDDGTPKVDLKALKVYEGLKVDDMVKVTNRGNFYNEDGVVRRLKDGKIFVRFYTYGTMFEEWLRPTDVRKLKAEEVLRGLSGPTAPVTQQEFDEPQRQKRDSEFMQSARGTRFGNRGQIRNRREDRNASRFHRDNDPRNNVREERENWNWYQNEQRNKRNDQRSSFQDGSRLVTPGSRDWNNRDRNERFNRENQFGQKPNSRQNPRDSRSSRNQRFNRQNDAAISGDDWSAFVSNPGVKPTRREEEPEQDDFFASLMKDLSKGVESNVSKAQGNGHKSTGGVSKTLSETDDDFFTSLISDLEQETQPMSPRSDIESNIPATRGAVHQSGDGGSTSFSDSEDDFFASIMSDIEQERQPTPSSARDSPELRKSAFAGNLDDEFFASLEADLENVLSSTNDGSGGEAEAVKSDFGNAAAVRKMEPVSIRRRQENSSGSAEMGDFFGSLETELNQEVPKPDIDQNYEDEYPQMEEFVGETSSAQGKDDVRSKVEEERNIQSSPKSTPSSLNVSGLAEKTVPVLKDMLRERGLKVSGKKAELVARLQQASL